MREPGELKLELADEAATRAAGAALARALIAISPGRAMLALSGELGAGKTTLARGFLQALGVASAVRSPTYTLVESYRVQHRTVHHLDWYRLASGADLEGLGFRDLEGPDQWLLVEWPERVPEVAARADLALALDYRPSGRALTLTAASELGREVLAR